MELRIPPKKWNYFGGKAVVTTDPYPEEIDTQSIANTIMKPVEATAHTLLDEILACENEDGIIPVSFYSMLTKLSTEPRCSSSTTIHPGLACALKSVLMSAHSFTHTVEETK